MTFKKALFTHSTSKNIKQEWKYFTSRKSFRQVNGTGIHLNLKTIEISNNQTQKISTCSNSTAETLEEGVICSKLTITTVER